MVTKRVGLREAEGGTLGLHLTDMDGWPGLENNKFKIGNGDGRQQSHIDD
jgi:hypothetical protein